MSDYTLYRELAVPEAADGMRLDRFLALRFPDRSRSWIVRGIKKSQVQTEDGIPLRASHTVLSGMMLHIYLPGIAPTEPPPPLPPVVYEDEWIVGLNKPAGLLAHPAGTNYTWSVIAVARAAWPGVRMDLVHRLDRDTSGIILLTKDLDANRFLREVIRERQGKKVYRALVKGLPEWDEKTITARLGNKGGAIHLQQGVRDDGLDARTDVVVERRLPMKDRPGLSLVRCRIHTGRTHQIRVHLDHVGHPLLGDRLYGVPESVFLNIQEQGITEETVLLAGAPRHALHAAEITLPHPKGGEFTVSAPLPPDMQSWMDDPEALPWTPNAENPA